MKRMHTEEEIKKISGGGSKLTPILIKTVSGKIGNKEIKCDLSNGIYLIEIVADIFTYSSFINICNIRNKTSLAAINFVNNPDFRTANLTYEKDSKRFVFSISGDVINLSLTKEITIKIYTL